MFIPTTLPVMEAYNGATKELHQVEQEIAKLIPLMKAEKNDINLLNNAPETKKITRLLEQAFDTTVYFKWTGTATGFMGTYTAASAVHLDEKMHIYVSPSVVTLGKLTAGEVTGIILHEVGHNQINSLLAYLSQNYASVLQSIIYPQYAIPIHLNTLLINIIGGPITRMYFKALTKLNEYVYKYAKPIAKLYNGFLEFKYTIKKAAIPFTHTGANSILPLLFIKYPPMMLIQIISASNPFRYVEEKEADRFATEFGYGPELVSGMNKLAAIETANFVLNHTDNKFIHLIYDLTEVQISYLQLFFGAYPNLQNRMRTNMDILQKAATDPDLPPELRKSAQNELKRAKEIYDGFVKLEGDERKKKFFSAMNRAVADDVFEGKADWREVFMHLTKPIQRK